MNKQWFERLHKLYFFQGYDPRNCPDWYREELDSFMAENPDLELEEAADPKRLVSILYFYFLVSLAYTKFLQEKLEKPRWKQQTSC